MADPTAMILYIDDDELGLEARKELLEISGYDVQTACSGQEAWDCSLRTELTR